ncbi:MAG TPA: glutathione peroxidase [Chitinophagaceae bacterium]|nr:glutathione peroxidase [Chitinophagaceae bacterium]
MKKREKYRWAKRLLIILLMVLTIFFGYVELVNLNSRHMTYRQKVLKAVYPAWMWWGRLTGKNKTKLSNYTIQPPTSFYSLKDTLNNGNEFDFSLLKGKKVLLVNTASDCGYTDQYDDLQKLYEKYNNTLVIIGFPANDFKQQEKGTDEEIAQFCKANYGITFPLMKKTVVIKNNQQNEVFKWLTDSAKNGWNTNPPSWNFCKYLVNEDGILTNYFESSVSPMSKDVFNAIERK